MLLPQSYKYTNFKHWFTTSFLWINTQTFRRALTASVDTCAETKECPFRGVINSGRVWRKVPESDARNVHDTQTCSLQGSRDTALAPTRKQGHSTGPYKEAGTQHWPLQGSRDTELAPTRKQGHSTAPTRKQGHSTAPTRKQGHSTAPTRKQGHSTGPYKEAGTQHWPLQGSRDTALAPTRKQGHSTGPYKEAGTQHWPLQGSRDTALAPTRKQGHSTGPYKEAGTQHWPRGATLAGKLWVFRKRTWYSQPNFINTINLDV